MELQKHFDGKIQDSARKVALWPSYWCRAIRTLGSAGCVGKWAEEALGTRSQFWCVLCPVALMGEHELSLALNTTESKHDATPLRKCCGVCLCPAEGHSWGWAVLGCPESSAHSCSWPCQVTPYHTLALLHVGTGRHFFVLRAPKGEMVSLGTAQLWGKYSGSKCRSHWCWWKHFSWSQESAKGASAFLNGRKTGKNLKALKKQVCVIFILHNTNLPFCREI